MPTPGEVYEWIRQSGNNDDWITYCYWRGYEIGAGFTYLNPPTPMNQEEQAAFTLGRLDGLGDRDLVHL